MYQYVTGCISFFKSFLLRSPKSYYFLVFLNFLSHKISNRFLTFLILFLPRATTWFFHGIQGVHSVFCWKKWPKFTKKWPKRDWKFKTCFVFLLSYECFNFHILYIFIVCFQFFDLKKLILYRFCWFLKIFQSSIFNFIINVLEIFQFVSYFLDFLFQFFNFLILNSSLFRKIFWFCYFVFSIIFSIMLWKNLNSLISLNFYFLMERFFYFVIFF